MFKALFSFIIAFILLTESSAQLVSSVKGNIIDSETKLPLNNVTISIEKIGIFEESDNAGLFVINDIPQGNHTVQFYLKDYETQLFTVSIESNSQIDLGTVLLVFDLSSLEANNSLISLSDDDLNDDNGQSENMAGLLQSSRDVFQNRAAFDFGQGFFRVRGYDSQNAQVLINGVSMNKLFNGRPQWNNWGGLNDVTRNQELTMGLLPSSYSFGDLLGTTNISTRASKYRSGYRISSSYSNRTYSGRAMITYNSGLQKNGLAFSISSSRRWGNEGFIDGTLYDAFGFFGALEFKINKYNSLNLTAMYTPNRRGGSAAITERVFDQFGRKYNPYWGRQGGENRSSRIREVKEPIYMLSHFYENKKTSLTTNIVYQNGSVGRSRLDYANAPNPLPNYWRYLPYIKEKPQIDWNNLRGQYEYYQYHRCWCCPLYTI